MLVLRGTYADIASQRARQSVAQPAHQPPAFHRESITAVLPFGPTLGPAGEQFIEQTPWANPNHPSHLLQRQITQQQGSPVPAAVTGPPSGSRKHSHQSGGVFASNATTMVNGDSPLQMHKSHSSAGHDSIKASKLGASPALKQSIAQAS